AGGITVHPRPDERHIRRSDVRELGAMLKSEYPGSVEFNIEGYPTEDFMALVEETRPEQVTLVPDDPGQSTSDHGWDIPANQEMLKQIITRLKGCGARLALFVDDDPSMAGPARDAGADRVELYTGPYHHAFTKGRATQSIDSFARAASAMRDAGLGLNAGHDLNLDNLPKFLAAMPYIEEVSIGHALTVDALIMGMDAAVRAYVSTLNDASGAVKPQQLASSR
ncbi:MAG: pyridoxine 5'-phosphate synthase, partial [Rhodospirillales bacterium]|nr:pyridoxine 5'-phosphate synthase [Rhodospirillales bacterium]